MLWQRITRNFATADGPRDAVSQNLVNFRNKLQNKSITNRDNGVRALERFNWPTCSKQSRLVDCRIGVVNKLDRRRWVLLLTTRLTCRSEIFCPEFGKSSRGKYPNFGDTKKIPYNTMRDRWKKSFLPKTSSIRQSIRLRDRQTNTRRERIRR